MVTRECGWKKEPPTNTWIAVAGEKPAIAVIFDGEADEEMYANAVDAINQHPVTLKLLERAITIITDFMTSDYDSVRRGIEAATEWLADTKHFTDPITPEESSGETV